MQALYPVPNDNFELHRTAVDCTLFHVVKASGLPKHYLGLGEYGQWQIPRLAAEYLTRCDGRTTHDEICRSLAVPFRMVVDRIVEELTAETSAITLQAEPSPEPRRIFVTGDFDSFAPLHMSVEITDACNFECDHCYVSASPRKTSRRNAVELIELFDTMRANGVKVVELTGGECTTHPDFRRILEAAATRFHLVAVVTNGYLLGARDGLADYVASFDNVSVQISLDGTREFHDRFRNKPGSFDALCEGARRLTEQGVMLRIAASITPENIDQVEDIFHTAKELRATALAVAAITSFGRGSNLGMCAETDHMLQHEVMRRLAPYADDPLFDANRLAMEAHNEAKQVNCGAGWRTFGLNGATGEVRSCLFLAESKKFGSVDEDAYAGIFRSEYMAMFRDAPSPSATLETCRECSYLGSCQGCFAKAFRVSETEYPDCRWRRRYFPGMNLSLTEAGLPHDAAACCGPDAAGAGELLRIGRAAGSPL